MRIRHPRLMGAAAALVVLIGLGGAAPAIADTNEDLVSADQELGDAVDAFLDVLNDSSTSLDEVQDAADTFVADAQPISDEFHAAADGAQDSTIKGYATDFAGDVDSLIGAANDMSGAIDAQDQDAFDQAIDDFVSASTSYSDTADAYNQYVEDNPIASGDPLYALWLILLIVAIVFLIAAILVMVLARNHQGALPPKTQRNGTVRQTTLKGVRRNMVIGAALFVVGAAIPFIQYWVIAHNGGDHYYIFWYPLAVGGLLFLFSVGQYIWATLKVRREGSAPLVQAGAVATPPQAPGVAAPAVGASPTPPPFVPQPGQPDAVGAAAPTTPVVPPAPTPVADPTPAPTTAPAPAPSTERGPWEPKQR